MSSPIWLDVLPSLDAFGAPLTKGAKAAAAKAGKEAGKSFSDAAGGEIDRADPGAAYVEKLERSVDKAKQALGREKVAMATAREAQAAATARLEKAERDLEKARENGDPAALALAEAKLDTARAKQADSTEKAQRQGRKLADVQDELRTASGQLDRALASTASELRDLADAAVRAGDDVAESADEAEGAEGSWMGFAGAIGAAVGALGGVAGAWDSALQGMESRGQLQAGLGLSPAEAEKAGRVAGSVYASNWGGSLEEATSATRTAYQLLGEGPDTGWIASSGLAYEQAFGTDTQTQISAISQMLRTNLAPDAETAFDILVAGAQRGGDKAGDLADTFTEYGTQFRKLGLDGDVSMGLLLQGLNAGARDADLVADTFKELSIRAIDGSEATSTAFQALGLNVDEMERKFAAGGPAAAEATQQVLEALRGIEDPALRAQVATGLFGTQAEDMGDALYSLDLSTASAELGDFTGSTERMMDALTETSNPLDRVGRWFSGLGSSIGGKAIPFINDVLTGIEGVWGILTTGDYKRDSSPFGFEEDSAFIGFLFDVRDVLAWTNEKVLAPIGAWMSEHQGLVMTVLGGVGSAIALVAGVLVGGAVVTAISGFVAGLSATVGWVAAAVGGITLVVTAIGAFFTQTETGRDMVAGAWGFIQGAIAGFTTWWTTTGSPAVQTGIGYLVSGFTEVWSVVSTVFSAVGDFIGQVIVGVVWPALQQLGGFLTDTVFPILQRLWTDYVQPVFLAIGAAVVAAWELAIKPALLTLSDFLGNTLGPAVVWLWESVISPVFGFIGAAISWAMNSVVFPALDAVKVFISDILAPTISWLWQNVVQPAFAGISWAVSSAWAVISLIFAVIDTTIRLVLAPAFTWFKDSVIDPVWSGLRGTIESGWNFIRDNVFTPLKNMITNDVAPAFSTGVGSISGAWDGLRSAAMRPVAFVVDSVINKGIIDRFNTVADVFGTKRISHLPVPGIPSDTGESAARSASRSKATAAFAGGGILPGHSSYSDGDDQLAWVRKGEGWMVSEGLRDPRSRALFLAANSAALHGGTSFADWVASAGAPQAFAGGGIVSDLWNGAKGLAGDALDKLLAGYDFATEALSDPAGALKKVAGAAMGVMPGSGAMVDLAKGIPGKVIDTIAGGLSTAASVLGGGTGTGATGAGAGAIAAAAGGSLGLAQAMARQYGLAMTSFRRGGARTAGSGAVSMHALGRAMDFSNSSGPTAQMMAFFNAMHRFKPLELLYSPAGARQWRRSGNMADTSGVTKRMHYNHVHVAFAGGGLVPDQFHSPAIMNAAGSMKPIVYDSGGWLQPGLSLVNNASGVPEPIFTGQQGQSIIQMLERGGVAGGPSITVPITATQLADADVDRLAAEILRRIELALVGGGI